MGPACCDDPIANFTGGIGNVLQKLNIYCNSIFIDKIKYDYSTKWSRVLCYKININSDGFIADILNSRAQQKMKDYFYINQICFDGLNTIDHQSPKRNFIGLDDENIDIPSIHGQA